MISAILNHTALGEKTRFYGGKTCRTLILIREVFRNLLYKSQSSFSSVSGSGADKYSGNVSSIIRGTPMI